MGWQDNHLALCFEHPGIMKGEEAKYRFLGFLVNQEVTSEKKLPGPRLGLLFLPPSGSNLYKVSGLPPEKGYGSYSKVTNERITSQLPLRVPPLDPQGSSEHPCEEGVERPPSLPKPCEAAEGYPQPQGRREQQVGMSKVSTFAWLELWLQVNHRGVGRGLCSKTPCMFPHLPKQHVSAR